MKITFNQLIAGVLALLSLTLLGLIYFIPSHGDADAKTEALTAVSGCLATCIMYLIKAQSDATHAEQMSKMTDAIANSTPNQQNQQTQQTQQIPNEK